MGPQSNAPHPDLNELTIRLSADWPESAVFQADANFFRPCSPFVYNTTLLLAGGGDEDTTATTTTTTTTTTIKEAETRRDLNRPSQAYFKICYGMFPGKTDFRLLCQWVDAWAERDGIALHEVTWDRFLGWLTDKGYPHGSLNPRTDHAELAAQTITRCLAYTCERGKEVLPHKPRIARYIVRKLVWLIVESKRAASRWSGGQQPGNNTTSFVVAPPSPRSLLGVSLDQGNINVGRLIGGGDANSNTEMQLNLSPHRGGYYNQPYQHHQHHQPTKPNDNRILIIAIKNSVKCRLREDMDTVTFKNIQEQLRKKMGCVVRQFIVGPLVPVIESVNGTCVDVFQKGYAIEAQEVVTGPDDWMDFMHQLREGGEAWSRMCGLRLDVGV
ncbi:hypothetical protein DFH27DRAFT_657112 [Peziza echinospora]|nr:hypothetical protein DFH27DRAFT_657112 [Peziza echinospora]